MVFWSIDSDFTFSEKKNKSEDECVSSHGVKPHVDLRLNGYCPARESLIIIIIIIMRVRGWMGFSVEYLHKRY